MDRSPVPCTNWEEEEDDMLSDIIRSMECQNKWNDIAKELYKRSEARYFRKPKQCRERWRNYLDPQLQKGEWTVEDDRRLLELVLENGSRWSNISKILKTRT